MRTLLLLAAIVALCGFLRFHRLGEESFWVDEIITVQVSEQPPWEVVTQRPRAGHSPFFFLLMRGWLARVGISEFSARLPSALMGSLSVVPLFFWADLLCGRRVAMISALLFSVNALLISHAQEARLYSGVLFFGLCSTLFLFKALETGRRGWWISYAAASGWNLLWSGSSILISGVHLAWFFWGPAQPPAQRARFRKSLLLTAGMAIPFWGTVALLSGSLGQFWPFAEADLPLRVSEYFFRTALSMAIPSGVGEVSPQAGGGWSWLVGVVLILLVFQGIRLRSESGIRFLWLALLVPLLLLFAAGVRPRPRYLVFSVCALQILLAALWWKRPIRWSPIAVAVLMVAASFHTARFYRLSVYPSWRETASYIGSRFREGEQVYVYPGAFRYYFKKAGMPLLKESSVSSGKLPATAVWLAVGPDWPGVAVREGALLHLLKRQLQGGFELKETGDVGDVRIRYYSRPA